MFLFAPIVVVVVYSFNDGRLLIAWDEFGLAPYRAMLERPAIRSAVTVSLQVAVLSSLLATFLGTMAGVALARRPGRWTYWFFGLLLLVSVTPEIVDAVSLLPWVVFLGSDAGLTAFNNGIVRLVVGHSLFSTAVVSYIVRARLVGLDESLEEASGRPLRDAAADLPPHHRPARDARGARRVSPVLHPQPRQHDRLGVRPGLGLHPVAGVRALARSAPACVPRSPRPRR